jgi:hypothetical protein
MGCGVSAEERKREAKEYFRAEPPQRIGGNAPLLTLPLLDKRLIEIRDTRSDSVSSEMSTDSTNSVQDQTITNGKQVLPRIPKKDSLNEESNLSSSVTSTPEKDSEANDDKLLSEALQGIEREVGNDSKLISLSKIDAKKKLSKLLNPGIG